MVKPLYCVGIELDATGSLNTGAAPESPVRQPRSGWSSSQHPEMRSRSMRDAPGPGTPRAFTVAPSESGPPVIDRLDYITSKGYRTPIMSAKDRRGRREVLGVVDMFHQHFGGATVRRRHGFVYPRAYLEMRGGFHVIGGRRRRSRWRSVYRVGDAAEWNIEDRAYCWSVRRALRESVTGDFIKSDAPDSVATPDGHSGLDDYIGELSPCPKGSVRGCDCCRCPTCGIKSIRAREKTPKYACNGPECDATFDKPALRPARQSEPTGD